MHKKKEAKKGSAQNEPDTDTHCIIQRRPADMLLLFGMIREIIDRGSGGVSTRASRAFAMQQLEKILISLRAQATNKTKTTSMIPLPLKTGYTSFRALIVMHLVPLISRRQTSGYANQNIIDVLEALRTIYVEIFDKNHLHILPHERYLPTAEDYAALDT